MDVLGKMELGIEVRSSCKATSEATSNRYNEFVSVSHHLNFGILAMYAPRAMTPFQCEQSQLQGNRNETKSNDRIYQDVYITIAGM